jgi:F-type H+-transporting ATPase subunit c
MKALQLLAVAVAIVLVTAAPALAQPSPTSTPGPSSASFAGAGLGAIGAGLTIIGAGWGFGRIGAAALEGMARQPEIAGKVQTAMIVVAALLEGATFFALLVCMQVGGKLAAGLPF